MLFATGTYLVLQRLLSRIIVGLGLIAHGANLVLLGSEARPGSPPIVEGPAPAGGYTDPLEQALVLTAIVITFGITAFLLALAYRSWTERGATRSKTMPRTAGLRFDRCVKRQDGAGSECRPADSERPTEGGNS